MPFTRGPHGGQAPIGLGSLAASRYAMLVSDDERRFVDATDASLRLFRVTREELLSLRIDDIVPPQRRAEVGPSWEAFLERGAVSGVWECVRPGDGERLKCRYQGLANVLPGRHLSIISNVRAANGAQRLTAREREVLSHAAAGRTTREIAEELVLSPATVETHLRNAHRRLDARNRAQAVALAIDLGELQPLAAGR